MGSSTERDDVAAAVNTPSEAQVDRPRRQALVERFLAHRFLHVAVGVLL